jgi:hypothetical protein
MIRRDVERFFDLEARVDDEETEEEGAGSDEDAMGKFYWGNMVLMSLTLITR